MPVDVAWISGSAARRPISWIFARERGVEVVKARVEMVREVRSEGRRRKDIDAVVCGWFVGCRWTMGWFLVLERSNSSAALAVGAGYDAT